MLPPAPVGKVDPKSTARLAKLAEDHRRGLDFNFQIRSNKSYRNPSIYNKLVEFFGIEEGGSNFPKDVFDPRAYKADKKHSYKVKLLSLLKVNRFFKHLSKFFRRLLLFNRQWKIKDKKS